MWSIDIEKPGEDPLHIGIDDGNIAIEGNTGNCSGGIHPDTGQTEQGFIALRDLSLIYIDHDLRRLMQIPGPGVVAKTFPVFQDLPLLRSRHRLDVWKPFQPAFIIKNTPFHLSLLKHNLRDPDMIRVIISAPGQITAGLAKPFDQGLSYRFNF